MARIRTIKPDFWTSETIGSLTPNARLLFICTWNHADDEGRLLWNPAYLRSIAFMYDDQISLDDVADMMQELKNAGLVVAYLNKKKLAVILGFNEHQVINRPKPSKLPPPPQITEPPVESRLEPTSPDFENKITDESLTNHGHVSDESVLEKEKEKELKDMFANANGADEKPPVKKQSTQRERFELFWQIARKYYKQINSPIGNKKQAFQEFQKLNPSDLDCRNWLIALRKQVANKKQSMQNVGSTTNLKHLSGWLKNESWEDDVIVIQSPKVINFSSAQRYIEKPLFTGSESAY